jgi:hypothetical protein
MDAVERLLRERASTIAEFTNDAAACLEIY